MGSRRQQRHVAAQAARSAKLVYVEYSQPGLRRVSRGKGFDYLDARGRKIRDVKVLRRIRSLVLPPAWRDVWICSRANGHLQATGRDARGRKQYRYHPRWRETRDESKYHRIIDFAKSLPRIRRRVRRDLQRRGMPREKVLAAVVRLLETTLIRVGNDEYARTNRSFGLTTLRNNHARVRGTRIQFEFRGKGGIQHEINFDEPQLAAIVAKCQDLPGQELFEYVDENGTVRDIGSADVNDYLRDISGGQEFTAKDFRTWVGTALAAQTLQEFEDFDSHAGAKRNVTRAIERVAQRLGNTTAICRKCYIHPAILEAYMDRSLVKLLKARTEKELRTSLADLSAEEAAVLALLQQRMQRELAPEEKRNRKTKRRARSRHRRIPR